MKEKLRFLLCIWFMVCGSCVGRFAGVEKSMEVTSPGSLKGLYECAILNHGVLQMVGTVVYPKANQKACRSFEDLDISFKSQSGGLPTFLLADRGDCYFGLKAWRAQNGGAAAILVADDRNEPLITMYTPEEENLDVDYLQNITIPSALITKSLGDSIKKALSGGEMVNINVDWAEPLPHPDEQVDYEIWTATNNYECGQKCDNQIEFTKSFKGVTKILEQKGYTQFIQHYMTWFCPAGAVGWVILFLGCLVLFFMGCVSVILCMG